MFGYSATGSCTIATRPMITMRIEITMATTGRSMKNLAMVQTYFGDAAPLLPDLLDLPDFGVGIDLFETDVSSLSEQEKTSKALVLGVVDSRESFVENPNWIAATARKFSEKVDARDLVFASNSDLKFVPQGIANQKLEALSKASELFEESR